MLSRTFHAAPAGQSATLHVKGHGKGWGVQQPLGEAELCPIKKNEFLLFAVMWMDLENIMLSEINHTEKDKYCMISLTCGI